MNQGMNICLTAQIQLHSKTPFPKLVVRVRVEKGEKKNKKIKTVIPAFSPIFGEV